MKPRKAAWIEDSDLIQLGLDRDVLQRILSGPSTINVDRRASTLRSLPLHSLSFDRAQHCLLRAQVYAAEAGFVVIADEADIRAGDTLYLSHRGLSRPCRVRHAWLGRRANDKGVVCVLAVSA